MPRDRQYLGRQEERILLALEALKTEKLKGNNRVTAFFDGGRQDALLLVNKSPS